MPDVSRDIETIDLMSIPMYWRGLIYGDMFAGKTHVAASQVGPVFTYVYNDNKWVTIKNTPHYQDKKFNMIKYQGVSQLKSLGKEIQSGSIQTDVLVIDTLNSMIEDYLDLLLGQYKWSKNTRPTISAGPSIDRLDLMAIPGTDDYHAVRNAFRPLIKSICQLPCDVLFLAHLKEPSPINPAVLQYRPNLTNAIYQVVGREVYFMGKISHNQSKGHIIDFENMIQHAGGSVITSLNGKQIDADDLSNHLQEWKQA